MQAAGAEGPLKHSGTPREYRAKRLYQNYAAVTHHGIVPSQERTISRRIFQNCCQQLQGRNSIRAVPGPESALGGCEMS